MSAKKITDEQLIECRNEGMTYKQIAAEFGLNQRTIERRCSSLTKAGKMERGSTIGADGYKIKGESVMYNRDGEKVATWVKTNVDAERMEIMMREAAEAFAAEMPREKPVKAPKQYSEELLALYPVFDLHIGALAHRHESGENYDTAEAERVMNGFFDYAVHNAPDAERGVMLIGGDFLHSDGLEAVTPASGHVLDQDSRYAKLVYVAIRSVRRAIRKMLEKHDHVELQIIEGNHDQSGMIWLRAAMAAAYEDEPRVTVDVSPQIMHVTRWGKTLLGYTHGHTMKKPDVRLMALARDFRRDFGECEYVYTHSGHWHHQTITETHLGIDEIHSQLGAKDAYAARGGWRSYRQAAVIVYSKEFGEVGRFVARPEMFM